MNRVDLALARVTFLRRIAYRGNWIFTVVIGGAGLLASLALWESLLADGAVGGYDWYAMRGYLIIGYFSMTVTVGSGDWLIAQRILDGLVAVDLTKPVDFQRARAAEFIGGLFATLPGALFAIGAAALIAGIPAPASPLAGALTLVSIALVFPLSFGVIYLGTLACFWTRRFLGIVWARDSVLMFFSGMLVPVALFPDWLKVIAWALPFVHFTTTPASIYLGRVSELGALGLLAAEAAWAIALWWLARLIWNHAVKKVTIHGG
ncbi:ABC transporter permease [Glycomyces buryatensis]|uniref:Antibiotic ABC transporter permease n=1 Tax=Glycomyces buryatensis TaxID=2570927 RepID=A0A4S8Q3E2_9ACTN|nr:ABC-2 family transporter protein [Glycomyces buryatensis]THV38530.1 antibiotic ABC transporter permease [Glycomyces buryatensis]